MKQSRLNGLAFRKEKEEKRAGGRIRFFEENSLFNNFSNFTDSRLFIMLSLKR